ncbi:zinc ribbon domain-containing protein [Kitasatospora sp. NPDC004745]|uniref:NADase-type glycan-binding domain-containing protein n=1 Tax=Kitasatospora sp. NPDC004745 TaxID=3364019 RepID=UPI0036CD53FE
MTPGAGTVGAPALPSTADPDTPGTGAAGSGTAETGRTSRTGRTFRTGRTSRTERAADAGSTGAPGPADPPGSAGTGTPGTGAAETGTAGTGRTSRTGRTLGAARAADPAPVQPGPVQPRPEAVRQPEADPVAVQPAKPVAPRPVVRPSTAEEAQVGPPCPRCQTPNRPDRRFCRRCAAPLTVAEAAPALPWWRTRWPFRRRVRIGGSGTALRRMIAVLVVAALVVAGVLLYPAGRNVYEDVLDKLRDAKAITPTGVEASAAAGGHPAAQAVDGLSNSYWAAPRTGDSISFTFAKPFRLVDVIVHGGSSTEPQEFQKTARPIGLDLRATSSDGKVHEQKVTLNDKPGPQTVLTGVSDVVKVTLVVREAAGPEGGPIALAEVEFFKR